MLLRPRRPRLPPKRASREEGAAEEGEPSEPDSEE